MVHALGREKFRKKIVMKISLKRILAGLCLATVLALPMAAKAVSYDITVDHSSGSGLGTAPYGTVKLTQNGTGVDFVVSLTSGYGFVLTGAADFMDFKFNATGVVVGDITVVQNVTGVTLSAKTGSFTGDGTGSFAFGITGSPDQGNGGSGKITGIDLKFNVANSAIADFTTPNADGFIFVADLISPDGKATGPAAVPGDQTHSAPDGGSTMALLGTALVGLGLIRSKFGKKS